MSQATVLDLAQAHGLNLSADGLGINEAGLDYRVVFAADEEGTDWVLRIPRRADVTEKIADEARILDFVRSRISVAVPDWRIQTPELIAYPLLPGEPGLTLSDEGEPEWHFDIESVDYAASLGRLIGELHSIDTADAAAAGIPTQTADDVRAEWSERLDTVSASFTIASELSERWKAWLGNDRLWPEFTAFTHGELYPAHLLLGGDSRIRSVLDWTTAKVGDPAIDFMYHWMISGPEAFQAALDAYEQTTGRVPAMLAERSAEIVAAGPLNYAAFALISGEQEHADAAAAQLNPQA